MEPSTDLGWGRPAWTFLHGLTLDPTSGTKEKVAQKQVLKLLMTLLPCPTCRVSYQTYCSNTLGPCSLEDLGNYVCRIHDKVNLKLEKDTCNKDAEYWKTVQAKHFQDAQWSDESFGEDMFYFLFAIVSNYPKKWGGVRLPHKYVEFFTVLASALGHRKVGQCMQRYLKSHPLEECNRLANRHHLTTWLYEMYQHCRDSLEQIVPLKTIVATMESIRKISTKK